MRIFLINLGRRPDRLAAMEEQAGRLGLDLTRIAAVDARAQDPQAMGRRFETSGPLGEIPLGDKACALSHRLAWQKLAESGETFGAVLEDDVVLSPGAGRFLKDAGWIGPDTDLVKLEHYGPPGQRILVSDFRDLGSGFALARLASRHTGAAAYILSRAAAERLLAVNRFTLPVDHLLFNPNNSPLFAALRPLQLIPAVARQQDFTGETSDIEATRVGLRKFDLTYVKRELVRFGYDLRLIPRQIVLAASGRASFVRIGMEPIDPLPEPVEG